MVSKLHDDLGSGTIDWLLKQAQNAKTKKKYGNGFTLYIKFL